jgi:8-oxo-dGTP pyrophosphatase MutT (NUDIX family)
MKDYSYGICPYKIENSEVQILLIQPKGHLEWGFIKGKIDSGETKTECAIRECLEETNIIVDGIYLEQFFEQENKRKDVGIFLVDCCNLDLSRIKLEKREIEKYSSLI